MGHRAVGSDSPPQTLGAPLHVLPGQDSCLVLLSSALGPALTGMEASCPFQAGTHCLNCPSAFPWGHRFPLYSFIHKTPHLVFFPHPVILNILQ